MLPLIAVWPYALVYWGVFALVYAPEAILNQRSRGLRTTHDKGSFALVMGVQIPFMAGAYAVGFTGRVGALDHRVLWFWVGVAIMIAGGLLRRHCFRMLGPSFTAVVVVKPGQQVIERGAYRWIRHPSYSAAALIYVGTTLPMANWLSVVIMLAPVVLTYGYRVRVEERALVEVLGEPYRDYMRRTKRFIPLLV